MVESKPQYARMFRRKLGKKKPSEDTIMKDAY